MKANAFLFCRSYFDFEHSGNAYRNIVYISSLSLIAITNTAIQSKIPCIRVSFFSVN